MTNEEKRKRINEILNRMKEITKMGVIKNDEKRKRINDEFYRINDEMEKLFKSLRRCKGLTDREKNKLENVIQTDLDDYNIEFEQALQERSMDAWAHFIFDNRGCRFMEDENTSKLAKKLNSSQMCFADKKYITLRKRVIKNALNRIKKERMKRRKMLVQRTQEIRAEIEANKNNV